MSERTERCETCRWWENISVAIGSTVEKEGEIDGWCRRYPPGVSHSDEEEVVWPQLAPLEWCGEWQAKMQPTTLMQTNIFADQPGWRSPEKRDHRPDRSTWLKTIGDHCLSIRVQKALAWHSIMTVDDLCSYFPDALLEMKNFGVSSLAEVESALASIGRCLQGRATTVVAPPATAESESPNNQPATG